MNTAKKIIKEQGIKKPDKKEEKAEAKSRKYLILIIVGALAVLGGIFVVCYTQLRPRAILTVEGPAAGGETATHTINYSDSVYDIYQMESMYNAYGMDWDQEQGKGTLSSNAKKQIMQNLKQREVLVMQAEKEGTVLDDAEKEEINKAVEEAMATISQMPKSVKGLSESDVRASIEKQRLAEKEKKKIIDGFDIDDAKLTAEVNKTDFRQYTLQYYTISKEDETSDAEEKPMKDDATIQKEKSDMQDLENKAKTAEDFTKLLTDSDNDSKDDNTGITYTTRNLLEKDEDFADKATRDLIKKMNNDQVSFFESDKAFFLVKMINNNDPEAYDNEVKNKISTEENNRYQTYYDETLKKQYKFKVQSYWKSRVTIGGITA